MAPSAPIDENDKPSDGRFLDPGGTKGKETRQYGLAVDSSQNSIKALSDDTISNLKRHPNTLVRSKDAEPMYSGKTQSTETDSARKLSEGKLGQSEDSEEEDGNKRDVEREQSDETEEHPRPSRDPTKDRTVALTPPKKAIANLESQNDLQN